MKGFVRKKTTLSASVVLTSVTRAPESVFRRLTCETPYSRCRCMIASSVRGILVPATSTISYCANNSVRVSACASANRYSSACRVDKVSNFPCAQRISISSPSSSRVAYSSGNSLTICPSFSLTSTSSLSTMASAISGFRFSRSAVARIGSLDVRDGFFTDFLSLNINRRGITDCAT